MNQYDKRFMARAAKRRAIMQALKDCGWSLQKIGDKYGLTRERIRQILKSGKRP